MKNRTSYFILLLFICGSCNYLDITPDNIATLDNAFIDKYNAEKYLFTCYSYLPKMANSDNNPGIVGSDEIAVDPYYGPGGAGEHYAPCPRALPSPLRFPTRFPWGIGSYVGIISFVAQSPQGHPSTAGLQPRSCHVEFAPAARVHCGTWRQVRQGDKPGNPLLHQTFSSLPDLATGDR